MLEDKYRDATWNGSSFWHGTSSIFLDSIRNTGLGAINPATDYKLLDVLGFLYDEIIRNGITHPVFLTNKSSIEAAIAQGTLELNGMLLNFKHDGVYVSASPIKAAYYACLNLVGSEILEKCLILLSVLIDGGKEPKIPDELDVFGVRKYLDKKPTPIMIEITEITDDKLLLENGADPSALLKEMREMFPNLPIAQQFERLQFCNFKLLNPIPRTKLRFYEVDFEGDPKTRNFQYYLSRI
ncbi:hypothetical protein GCM10022289_21130 [Pedobacter jeongneungensis]|uniref:Uncharacterized protein n=1 Tax=Pedobacter jeongneungensis TaxID=947309 RepID=A0ABP8BDX7_9SPHI